MSCSCARSNVALSLANNCLLLASHVFLVEKPGSFPISSVKDSHVKRLMRLDRAAIESRLRNMWNKISEEMTALAEERSDEDVREELMSWMGQVPTVLQDIIPKKLVSLSRDVHLNPEPQRTDPHMVENQSGEYNEKAIFSKTPTS